MYNFITDDVINIDDIKPFGEGKMRRCYVHTHDKTKCIKIHKNKNDNYDNIEEYRATNPEKVQYHNITSISYGFCKTTQGIGLVSQLLLLG